MGELLPAAVRDLARRLTPRGQYRPPEPAERAAVLRAVAALPHDAGARRALEGVGLAVDVMAGEVGHRYLVARSDPDSERAWGLLAIPVDGPARLLVEVPHPSSDHETEEVGLAVLAVAPDAVYLQAGAHRRAGGGRADVAHQEDSLFHALAVDLSVRLRLPQLQLHGFGARANLAEDVVLASGPADPEPPVRALADCLEEHGVSVCRAWSRRCPGLEGVTNAQAAAAARAGLPFAHVEMSASIRRRPDALGRALAALGG